MKTSHYKGLGGCEKFLYHQTILQYYQTQISIYIVRNDVFARDRSHVIVYSCSCDAEMNINLLGSIKKIIINKK